MLARTRRRRLPVVLKYSYRVDHIRLKYCTVAGYSAELRWPATVALSAVVADSARVYTRVPYTCSLRARACCHTMELELYSS